MIALKLTRLGPFMGRLLSSDCFDSFLLEEAVISMAVTLTLDGHLNRAFYPDEVWNDPSQRPCDLSAWSAVRPLCHEFIKGKQAPAGFRFVLHLRPDLIPAVLEKGGATIPSSSLRALLLTIRYDGAQASIVTGVSTHSFTMDRSADAVWDKAVQKFLDARGIEYDLL
ncbi:MAG: DUF5721 family protein [Eubacteriales bacterium]|nr:DUF5721 family protein [Eubacteriales bacterium]